MGVIGCRSATKNTNVGSQEAIEIRKQDEAYSEGKNNISYFKVKLNV